MSPFRAAWAVYVVLGSVTVWTFGLVKLWAADPWMGAAVTPVVVTAAVAAVQVAKDRIRKRGEQ